MHLKNRFNDLHHRLAQTFEARRATRSSQASTSELGEASRRLNEARAAVWDSYIRSSSGIR